MRVQRVVMRFGGLSRIQNALAQRTPPVEKMFGRLLTFYASAMTRRFTQFSRGGGDWPKLADSTIARRRHPKGGKRGRRRAKVGAGSVSILADTGILRGALSVGAAGNKVRPIPNGVAFGFADLPRGKGATLSKIAFWHHTGAGRNPVRRILVQPDPATRERMKREVSRTVAAILNGRA